MHCQVQATATYVTCTVARLHGLTKELRHLQRVTAISIVLKSLRLYRQQPLTLHAFFSCLQGLAKELHDVYKHPLCAVDMGWGRFRLNKLQELDYADNFFYHRRAACWTRSPPFVELIASISRRWTSSPLIGHAD